MIKKLIVIMLATVAVGLGAIQLVPYGRSHSNPPVSSESSWDSPRTRELARLACFDCHSNETQWPWYSNVAPISWIVQDHVDEGRSTLNFSEWDRAQEEADKAAESVIEGEMPPSYCTMFQTSARPSAATQQALYQGLRATLSGHQLETDEHDD